MLTFRIYIPFGQAISLWRIHPIDNGMTIATFLQRQKKKKKPLETNDYHWYRNRLWSIHSTDVNLEQRKRKERDEKNKGKRKERKRLRSLSSLLQDVHDVLLICPWMGRVQLNFCKRANDTSICIYVCLHKRWESHRSFNIQHTFNISLEQLEIEERGKNIF